MRFLFIPSLRLLKKATLFLVSGILVLGIVAFFALPPILKTLTEKQLTKMLRREVAVQQLDFNLLTLRTQIKGCSIKGREGEPFLTFERLAFDIQAASVFEDGPIIQNVLLKAPHVYIIRNEDLTYNFSDLLEEFTKKPSEGDVSPPESDPLPFSLNNIRIEGGNIDFDDKPKHKSHKIRDLNVTIPFLSNLPDYANVSVEPAFSVTVNGAPITLKAHSKPFSDTRETSVNVTLNSTDVARYVEYAPWPLPIKIPTGNLAFQAVVTFAQAKEQPPTVTVTGQVELGHWTFLDLMDRPLLQFSTLTLDIDHAELFSQKFFLRSVHLQSPDLVLHRRKDGNLEVSELLATMAAAPTVATPQPQEPSKNDGTTSSSTTLSPLLVNIEEIRCSDGKITYQDASLGKSFQTTLDAIQIVARSVSNLPTQPMKAEAAFRSEAGETISATSELLMSPLKTSGGFAIHGLKAKKYAPYYQKAILFEVEDGVLDLSGQYIYLSADKGGSTVLSEVQSTLSSLRLRKRGEKGDFLTIPVLEVKDATINLENKTIAVGEARTRMGEVRVQRDSSGRTNFEQLVSTAPPSARAKKNAGVAKPIRKPRESSSPWLVTLRKLILDKYSVHFEDRSPAEPVAITVRPLSLTIEDFSTKKGTKFKTTLQMAVNKTGNVNVRGPMSIEPFGAMLKIEAKTIPLLPFQPYFTQSLNIALTSGAVSADGNLSLSPVPSGPPKVTFTGQASATKFASVTKANAEDFLKWSSLYVGGIDLGTTPLRVDVKEVAMSDFYSRMIVNPDARLNVQDIALSEPRPETTQAVSSQVPDQKLSNDSALIRIGKVTLQGGTVDFSDRYIKPNYSARLTQMTGRVSEMSSVENKPADVDLRGRLDDAAPLEIVGKLNPFAQDLYVDLAIDFKDIDLNPLTPYIGKYAGYTVEKGKLSLGLQYLIADRKLQARNRVFLDQFTFGKETGSPEATKLPVRLAISLLKDRNGAIHLDLPVNGSLDDPQFSVWSVLLQMVTNLIAKAATAPFALLGAVFNGEGETASRLEFDYGRATLDSRAQEQLRKIASLLAERPALKLDISGYVDAEKDPEGLRRVLFERKLKARKLAETVKKGNEEDSLDAVHIDEKEYSTYLALAYKEEKFPKPRNLVGLAKSLPDEEMEKLILAHIEVTDESLKDLAKQRAQHVQEYLLHSGQLGSGQVFLVAPQSITQPPEGSGKRSRVEFAVK